MKTLKRFLGILLSFVVTGGLFLGITADAIEPAEGNPDIGCYEHGYDSHERRTVTIDESFDPVVYGELNNSFIYVDMYGNDETGDGTKNAPFATAFKAASVAQSGDTIKVGMGVFNFTKSLDLPCGVSLEGTGDGESGGTVFTSTTLTDNTIGGNAALLRIQSADDSVKEDGHQHVSDIRFDGQNKAAWAIDVADRHNVSIHDCTVVNFRETGVSWHSRDLATKHYDGSSESPLTVPGTFVMGGRFYNNYLKDNTRFEGWGRGSLFLCGLEDFHIYNNTMIEDVRTSPDGTRGVPLKVWYYEGWVRDIKIHDNDIQRLGSATFSSDANGWDFAIEVAAPYAGMEICSNHFIGSVDTNGGYVSMGDKTYDYATWIHDNTWTADPTPKVKDDESFAYNEEYAITLERVTQKTIIEYNTVEKYDTVLYFNARKEISDITFRYNLCTELGGNSGTMFRLDGRTDAEFSDPIEVKNLAIYNNIFSSIDGNGASGFGIRLGQEMNSFWSAQNIEVSNNVFAGNIYPYWFSITNMLTSVSGLYLENNSIYNECNKEEEVSASSKKDYVNDYNLDFGLSGLAADFENDWYPTSRSSAIDGGKNITIGLVDLAGNRVPYILTYNLTTSVNGGHGTISSGESDIIAGENRTVTFTPNTDYEIDTVTVNGTEATITGNSLTLLINEDKDVVVSFKVNHEHILNKTEAVPASTLSPAGSAYWTCSECGKFFSDEEGKHEIEKDSWIDRTSGWKQIGGKWSYLENGIMQTGWVKDVGKWYYMDNNGVMQTGWVKHDNSWYYLNTGGSMKTGWLKDNGKWYYLKSSGAMATGWLKIDGVWYWFNTNGSMKTGWLKDGGKWYYLKSNGAMATGWLKIDGVWYYFNTNGTMKTGWLKEDNKWYYLKSGGAMACGEFVTVGSKTYHFNASGVCTNP